MHAHIYAFDLLIREMDADTRVDAILINFIDTVDEQILPVLAEELDILGVKGWLFADTVAKQRALVKHAIRLKRKAGTAWAIEEVLKIAGFSDFQVIENTGAGGLYFKVRINVGSHPVNGTQVDRTVALIEKYKRKSIPFEGLRFYGFNLIDNVHTDDSLLSINDDNSFSDSVRTRKNITLDGSWTLNGTQNLINESDTVRIKII